ncbi:acyl-CoA dehydrogenase family protein [Rhodococcus sp. NPDC003382]
MILAENEDLVALQQVAREFLGSGELAAPQSGSVQFDRAKWSRACSEIGIAGVSEPDEFGGAGFGFAALAVVLEEAGRSLSSLPILSSVVLGQGLLTLAGDERARAELLPALLDGSRTATVATGAVRSDRAAWSDSVTANCSGDDWTLSGTVGAVLDGATADWLFVRAETAKGPAIFVVETDAAGVGRTVQDSMDLTRSFARIDLHDVPAQLIRTAAPADTVLASLADVVAVAVACEQLGGAEEALRIAVAYVAERVQFGREIGSFQAIKHRCADLAIAVDEARSAVAHAVWALHEGDDALRLAAPLAAVVAGRTFLDCARENVHLHGGIGFTWEHAAHLYFRRATSDATLFGDAERHRERVLSAVL